MNYKVKKTGERFLLDCESLCMHCDGGGLANSKLCKVCNGHGVLVTYQNNGFYHIDAYDPTKEQLAAMETLGGVA